MDRLQRSSDWRPPAGKNGMGDRKGDGAARGIVPQRLREEHFRPYGYQFRYEILDIRTIGSFAGPRPF